ncbi:MULTISPECIES: VOC family protein [Sphingobium]|uniref:VOC family protein n=1 Tax=Sphingobium sp. MI1205 TaxID=407020 RepID=UPI00077005FD|nr:VOC family protein [Sphingobium sp. MI1205]AMK19641.1 methylmalonyl-CoA epimerase [Sphingobium sp. MI1205]
MSLVRYPIIQYAYVVNDVEAACLRWADMFGAGPFLIVPNFRGLNGRYRGQPAGDIVTHALGQCGAVNIQFTQQHNDAPSVWRDMYPKGSQGLHHVMLMPDDIESERQRFEEAGCVIGAEFDDPLKVGEDGQPITARVYYIDARPLIGCFVELFEGSDLIRGTLETLARLNHDPVERSRLFRDAL